MQLSEIYFGTKLIYTLLNFYFFIFLFFIALSLNDPNLRLYYAVCTPCTIYKSTFLSFSRVKKHKIRRKF